jgi:hypothetical protein
VLSRGPKGTSDPWTPCALSGLVVSRKISGLPVGRSGETAWPTELDLNFGATEVFVEGSNTVKPKPLRERSHAKVVAVDRGERFAVRPLGDLVSVSQDLPVRLPVVFCCPPSHARICHH